MKRIIAGLLAAVMVLALGGCGLTADESVRKEPVRQLECTQPGALPVIVPMEGARAALAWSDYTTEKTTVQVVDVYGDTVRGEVELEGSWELTEQRLAGGRLALRDWESGLWRFLSADLKDEGTWAAADMNGYFSYDGKSYWFLRDHVLRRQEVAGGEAVPVQLSADLRIADITGMDAESGRMTVQVLLSPYSLECGTAVVDTESGEVLLLQREVYQATFSGESACLLSFDMEKLGYSARYGSSGRFRFADASLFMDTGGDLYAVGSPAYLMGVGAEHSTLYGLGAEITACSLAENGVAGEMYVCRALPGKGTLVGAVYRDGACRVYALEPEQLTFAPVAEAAEIDSPMAVDETLVHNYWSALDGTPVAENMQEARQYADTLEEKYGVRILLSAQGREAAALCDKALTLTDTMDAREEARAVGAMLAAMERSFGLYPEGFLRQFRDSNGEGGLCFLPVAHIESSYGVVGCAYEYMNWQYVALDVQNAYMPDGLICHEIWHSAENKILSHDYSAFAPEKWDVLNPEGFVYGDDPSQYDSGDLRWTLYSSGGEGVYFVDGYGRSEAREDRARIMEYFMAHEDEAAMLIQSPHIRAKLELMCRAVRETFDTTGWGTPRWENLL